MAPDPNKIMAVLIAVLEDQEGVKIEYTLEKKTPPKEEPA